MTLLENPDNNPCFGCGPKHPRGLRLQFSRERLPDGREAVVTTYTPQADEIGWPGLFHTSLHFMVLFEACYWAALELGGKVHVATGPQTFDQKRLPRVGQPFRAWAVLVPGAPEGQLQVFAQSEMADGRVCATLTSTFRPESRARIEKAGLPLPQYLLDDMAP